MYQEVVERYFRMGAGQFLRDFRRDFQIKKSLAHRKEVLEKKKKAEENKMKVHLPEIEQDRSTGKKMSHVRLLALVNKLGEGRNWPRNLLEQSLNAIVFHAIK